MKKGLKGTPKFAFVFTSINYDEKKLLNIINSLLPETKIYGGTASLGPMVPNAYLGANKQSLAILGVSSPKIVWGIGSSDLNKYKPEDAGEKAILAAINNAGKNTNEKPNIILITAAPGSEELIIKGIEKVTGKNVPIFGGSSGDNEITGKWKQFSGTNVYSNGVSLAVAYTNLKVAYAYETGYPVTEQTGVVTKAKKRIIYEIDNKPAAEVYNKWTGGVFEKQINKPGKVWGILNEAALYPIAKILRVPNREPFYLAVHPLSIHSDHSLEVFADMKNGDEIALLHGSWNILMNRFRTTPEQAMSRFQIKKGEGVFALYTFCAGSMLAIPKKERPKMPLLLQSTIGNIPFIGNFTFGEQGFIPGIGNQHGNLVNSMVIFSNQ